MPAAPAQAEGLEQRRVPVKYLSAIQKNAQKKAFKVSGHMLPFHEHERVLAAFPKVLMGWQQARAEQELKKVLTADDAPAALRLVLHDAATYNTDSGTGGLNGSIVLG